MTVRDRRYHGTRWRKLARSIPVRDLYQCWVPYCTGVANVADHINPVYEGMPDSEFFDPYNLRASCRRHNVARGFAASLEGAVAPPAPGRTAYGPRRIW